MSAQKFIAESLISCRNILLGGHCGENVETCLRDILTNLENISESSAKEVIKVCVSEILMQVKSSEFVSAGLILNLIHNLPFDGEGEREWDVDYFLSIELPAFLEHFDEVKSARKILLCVFGHVSSWGRVTRK